MDGTTIIEAEILGVTEKTAHRKSDGAEFTMYEIQVSDGTQAGTAVYSTTFLDNAEDAYKLLNKTAKLTVKIEQNGKWINRYLQKVWGETEVAPSGFGAAVAESSSRFPAGAPTNGVTSHTAKFPASNGASRTEEAHLSSPPVAPSIVEQAKSFENDTTERIHRQTACKVAAMLFMSGDSQIDFWDNVDTLVRYFENGVKPLAVEISQESR